MCFTTCSPAHNKALAVDGGMSDTVVARSVFHYALAKDYELDIADDGDTAPGHGGGPEGCMVAHTTGDCGEMGVR